MKVKIPNTIALERDTHSMGIINTNQNEYERIKLQRKTLMAQREKIDNLHDQVTTLTSIIRDLINTIELEKVLKQQSVNHLINRI